MSGDGNGFRLVLFRGAWCVYWRELAADGRSAIPRRASLRTADKALAQRKFKDFLKNQTTPQGVVSDIYQSYIEDKGFTGIHHRAAYAWKNLEPHFGSLRPDQATKLECRAYITKRRKAGVGDGTIRRELTILRAALNWNDKNNLAEFELPPKPAPMERYLTRDEYQALMEGAAAHHVRLFIVLALATAGRAGAILDLTWDRVDFERGIIKLAKGGQERMKGRATVPMTQTARAELEAAAKAAETEYVVEYAGHKVGSVTKGLNRAATRAGLEGVTPHVLRHTAAVWMAEARVPMAEIAQYLGHTDSRITERVYARYSPDFLRHAAAALEAPGKPSKIRPHQAAKKRA